MTYFACDIIQARGTKKLICFILWTTKVNQEIFIHVHANRRVFVVRG